MKINGFSSIKSKKQMPESDDGQSLMGQTPSCTSKYPFLVFLYVDPMATPPEYAEIKCPAFTILMSKSAAMSLRIPIIPNSTMPSANVPKASESSDFFTT